MHLPIGMRLRFSNLNSSLWAANEYNKQNSLESKCFLEIFSENEGSLKAIPSHMYSQVSSKLNFGTKFPKVGETVTLAKLPKFGSLIQVRFHILFSSVEVVSQN